MGLSSLSPPGLIVILLKGDPAERRVNAWLEGGAMLVLAFLTGIASRRG